MKEEAEKECARMIAEAKEAAMNIFSEEPADIVQLEDVPYQPLQAEIQDWEKIIVREMLEDGEYDETI